MIYIKVLKWYLPNNVDFVFFFCQINVFKANMLEYQIKDNFLYNLTYSQFPHIYIKLDIRRILKNTHFLICNCDARQKKTDYKSFH